MAEVRPVPGATARGPFLLHALQSAAFPTAPHPGAAVYLPSQLGERTAVVLYLHGHENCAENVLRKEPGSCTPGGEIAPSADLPGQLDASGRDAILIVPELRFFAKSSEPGALGEPGALAALVAEVLAIFGGAAVGHLIVVSHSGGYRAAAALCTVGGLPVQELYLLDSLYGNEAAFDSFVQADLPSFFADAAAPRRLCNLYGPSTADRSVDMAHRVSGWLRASGQKDCLCADDHPGDPTDEQLAARLVFKRVKTGHSDIPRTHLLRLFQNSDLPRAREG